MRNYLFTGVIFLLFRVAGSAQAIPNKRAADLGLRIGAMAPGKWDAITDVPGVKVGQTTLVQGSRRIRPVLLPCGPISTTKRQARFLWRR